MCRLNKVSNSSANTGENKIATKAGQHVGYAGADLGVCDGCLLGINDLGIT